MWIKNIIRKIIYKERSSSQAYISYMRSRGAKIGDRVTIFSPKTTSIDMTRPWLIDIGNDVQITEGVTLLTHGYDWAVLKGVYGEILGSGGGYTDRKQCFHWNENNNLKRRSCWQ